MDVFISWTRADEDVKNTLVERLKAENITCADSDEFCQEEYSTECIEAIDHCKVFIVIVSDASMQGGYVLNEVIHARKLEDQGKLNFLVYKITDAPYSAAFNFQMNHISAVFGNLVRGGATGLDTIIKRTKNLLESRKNGKPEQPFDVSLPVVDGMQIVPPGYFVEHSRDEALSALSAAFEKSNIVVFKELFGYGKRATIKKYAQLTAQDYDSQVIVQNDNATLREFFLATLQFANVNPKLFAQLEGQERILEKLRFLKKLGRRHLLVISDVRFEAAPDTWLYEQLKSLECHIIITSQESALQFRDWFPVVDLGRMEDAHLKELFFHHYDYAYEEERQALDAPLTQYFAQIGGHTKTVELTASVLSQEWGVHPEEIPEYLKLRGCEGLQLKDRILNQLDYLLDVGKLSHEERTALLVAAYVAVPYVSEKKFKAVLEWLGITNWQCVMGLDKRRWLDLDMRNRTVSIEPLIAQIVLGKIPDEHCAVATACFRYWTEKVINSGFISVSNDVFARDFDKLANLLTNTGMEEAAQILRLMRQYILDRESMDPAWMKAAIEGYQAQYPKYPSMKQTPMAADRAQIYQLAMQHNSILAVVDEDDEENDDDLMARLVEHYKDAYPQAAARLDYEITVMSSMSNSFLPQAKAIAADVSLFNWDAKKALPMDQGELLSFDFKEIVGVSREDVQQILVQLREAMEADEDFDDEDSAYLICIEMIAAMDAIYRRDPVAMMDSLRSAIRGLFLLPDEGQEDVMALIYVVAQMAALIFISAGVSHSAILLCEEILRMETQSPHRGGVIKAYIMALQNCQQYNQVLFDAYEEGLRLFSSTSGEFLDGRQDSQAEEKQWYLMYAEALAWGERLEKAEAMFAQAEKLGMYLKTAETLKTAEKIADRWIYIGAFDRAVRFADRYLESKHNAMLFAHGISKDNPSLANLRSLREMYRSSATEDAAGEDPLRYIDYYTQFSRENSKAADGKYYVVADKAMKFDFSHLTDEQLIRHAEELKQRARHCKPLELAPEAFALASEAGFRTLGYRHHYVQYIGAAVMADGKVAEILNGEGKTYTVVPVAFLQHLYGNKVMVVDSSPYLTERNYDWMRSVYHMLGMTCQHIPDEYYISKKRNDTQADVCYISLRHLMFGYLYSETELLFQRHFMRYDCAIIDEIDSVLVDEAEDQFRVASTSDEELPLEKYEQAWELACRASEEAQDYTYENGAIVLNRSMLEMIEDTFGVSYSDVRIVETLKHLENIVQTALMCRWHYELGVHYQIDRGRVVRENRRKGIFEPIVPAFEYFLCKQNGLSTYHARMELRRKVRVKNMITVRDLFRKFKAVCGTTATAVSFKTEFKEIYNLDYVAVPPEKPCIRQNYKMPLYVFMADKERAVVELVFEKNMRHQPVLLICQNVQESEHYAALLRRAGIPHQVLNARNPAAASDILSRAGEWDSVLIATFLVNRGTDIKLGGDAQLRTRREMMATGADVSQLQEILAKNRAIVADEKQRVIAAGGLCVIGTSFFADAREEQQTRGRAGRQGEVGESYVFWSLEDESMSSILSQKAVEKLQRSMEMLGVTENDSKMLMRVYRNTQQTLHNTTFAKIRSANDASSYLDESRSHLIGRLWELCSGDLTVEMLCKEWAEHPRTMENLIRFQKGETRGLFRLLQHSKDRLSGLRSRKAGQQLFDILYKEVIGWESRDKNSQRNQILMIQLLYQNAWDRFIEAVLSLVGKEHITKTTIAKQLGQIKEDILYETLENALLRCVK